MACKSCFCWSQVGIHTSMATSEHIRKLQHCRTRTEPVLKQCNTHLYLVYSRDQLVLDLHASEVVMDGSPWPHWNIYVLLSAAWSDELFGSGAAACWEAEPRHPAHSKWIWEPPPGPVSEKPRLELLGSRDMLHLRTAVTLSVHTPGRAAVG